MFLHQFFVRGLGHASYLLGDVPDDRPPTVVFGGGYRSTVAASLLERAGRDHLINLIGGVTAYEAAGHALVVDEARAQYKEIHA